MTLKELKPGESGTVKSIGEKGVMRVTQGVSIKVIKIAPLGDPIEVNIRGYALSLRKSDAEQIIVIK